MSTARMHDPAYGGGTILDDETIEGLIELGGSDDASLLLELVDLFLEDCGERMQKLLDASANQDLGTVEKMAHAMKSASANIGALSFSIACRELEQLARGSDPDEVSQVATNAKGMFDEVGEALASLKETYTD